MSTTTKIKIVPSLDGWGESSPRAALESMMRIYPNMDHQTLVEYEGRTLPLSALRDELCGSAATVDLRWGENADWEIEEDRSLGIGRVVTLDYGVEVLVTSIGRVTTGIGGNFREFSGKQRISILPTAPSDARKWVAI